MKEEWKEIEGFDGYLISNYGKVFSLKRNKLMSLTHNDKGYYYAQLYKDGKQHIKRLHRIVAKAFIPNPNNLPEINHIDGNKANNRIDNLEWCDRLHNMREAYRKEQIPPRKANKTSYKAKIVNQYDLNGNLINTYKTLHEASVISGIKLQTLSRYCLNTRKSKDYIWKYAD